MKNFFILSGVIALLNIDPLHFSNFLEYFIEGDKKIPIEYREKYLDIGLNCEGKECPDFYAKEFLYERPDKVMVVYEMKCAAGGICDIQNIAIYNTNEELIGHYPYRVHMADCGFSKEEVATFVSDTLLYIKSSERILNCDDEQTMSIEISLKEVDLTESPFSEIITKIDVRRLYPEASVEILEDDYVNALPVDSADYIRNEIFAAKGYQFKTEKWKQVFEQTSWYKPNELNNFQLSVIEQLNINKLIKRKNN